MRKFLQSNKKGQLKYIIVALLFLLVLGISTSFAYLLWTNIQASFMTTGFYKGDAAQVGNSFNNVFLVIDYIFILFVTVLVVGVAYLGWQNPRPAIFFVIAIFEGIFLGVISYFFNIFYSKFITNTVFSGIVTSFPNSITVLTNLHWIALILWVVASLVTFTRRKDIGFSSNEGNIP